MAMTIAETSAALGTQQAIFVWCEDSRSGFQFWKEIFAAIDKDIQVQSKGNNTRLRQAAEKITEDGNQYYILMDQAVDNADVLRELRRLNRVVKSKNNVKVIKVHSFEYVLLSFRCLEDWVFAEKDALKKKRTPLLEAREVFINLQENGGSPAELDSLKSNLAYSESMNSEQISAKLLWGITRNTGFETDKGHLGQCFVINCCEWTERQRDDICGLDGNHKSAYDKMNEIIEQSVLKSALLKAGIVC